MFRRLPLPAVVLAWQGPTADHPDAAPLSVAQALLSGGESSRLHQALVYRQRIAQAAAFQTDLHTDAGSLFAYAIAAVLIPVFVWRCTVARLPVLDLRLLRSRSYSAVMIAA